MIPRDYRVNCLSCFFAASLPANYELQRCLPLRRRYTDGVIRGLIGKAKSSSSCSFYPNPPRHASSVSKRLLQQPYCFSDFHLGRTHSYVSSPRRYRSTQLRSQPRDTATDPTHTYNGNIYTQWIDRDARGEQSSANSARSDDISSASSIPAIHPSWLVFLSILPA